MLYTKVVYGYSCEPYFPATGHSCTSAANKLCWLGSHRRCSQAPVQCSQHWWTRAFNWVVWTGICEHACPKWDHFTWWSVNMASAYQPLVTEVQMLINLPRAVTQTWNGCKSITRPQDHYDTMLWLAFKWSIRITHLISFHLTSSQQISVHLNCDWSRPRWTGSLHSGCDQSLHTQFRWNEVTWDKVRWDEQWVDSNSSQCSRVNFFFTFF